MTEPLRQRDWEGQFEAWARPPSQTEQEKCERAVRAIREAAEDSRDLAPYKPETFAQGSFANRVNVRRDSDVDVCILCSDVFFYDLPPGYSLDAGRFPPTAYTYAHYKNDVEVALVAKFGRQNVQRGNKAFDIHENTYRVDADAVACFEYRLYFIDHVGALQCNIGTALLPDDGGRRVTNFPRQQYANGVAKNEATGRRYKPLVRIFKCLRNEMEDAGVAAARPLPSFLIESLIFNLPDSQIGHRTFTDDVYEALRFIYGATSSTQGCMYWTESNGIKPLFGAGQEWTKEQVLAFIVAAWNYIGFG